MRRVLAWAAATVCAAVVGAHPASAQAVAWPSERPPHALPSRPVKFPPYEFRTLPNGLQVIAVSQHEEPAVSLRLIVRAGSAQDGNHPGVASLVSSLLDQGTTTRSAAQIASAIDSIGGALNTGAGPDLTFINCVVMRDSLATGLDLVSDLAQHPAFAPDEIDRQRQQMLSALRVSYDDPEYVANMVFDRVVYGFHPYGRPQAGTPDGLAALGREDLVAFHRTWFGANNAILAVVGDVSADEAFAGAARAFGTWAAAPAHAAQPPDPPSPTRRLVIVDKPGAVQTEIRVGNLAIRRRDSDFTRLDLAVKVLGGEGANRLHRVLRSERGLTYGASADLTGLQEAGDIEASTSTRTATTGETLRLMVDEFWRLTRDPVGQRELGGAQEYLTGSFPLTIETPSQIALQILNAVFFGLNLKDLETFRDRVNAVTPDDVQRVARAYIRPDRLAIVLVGDASTFVDQLPAAGFDTFERIPIAELDVTSPDLRRRAAAAGPAAIRPVVYRRVMADDPRALIEKAIAAKGGLKRLKDIRTVQAEQTTTVHQIGNTVTFKGRTSIAYPDKYRVESDTPRGKVVQVSSGGDYWVEDASGAHDAPPEVRESIQQGLQRDIIPLLIKAAEGSLVVRGVDADAPLAGVMISGSGMAPVTIFINQDTGFIERVRYDAPGNAGTTEEQFSDYRTVDGVRVPFHTVLRRPGAPVVERDITHIHFNVALPRALFTRGS